MTSDHENDPDPWCTSPDPEPVNEVTDIVTADYVPDRWGDGEDDSVDG